MKALSITQLCHSSTDSRHFKGLKHFPHLVHQFISIFKLQLHNKALSVRQPRESLPPDTHNLHPRSILLYHEKQQFDGSDVTPSGLGRPVGTNIIPLNDHEFHTLPPSLNAS